MTNQNFTGETPKLSFTSEVTEATWNLEMLKQSPLTALGTIVVQAEVIKARDKRIAELEAENERLDSLVEDWMHDNAHLKDCLAELESNLSAYKDAENLWCRQNDAQVVENDKLRETAPAYSARIGHAANCRRGLTIESCTCGYNNLKAALNNA